MVDKEFFVGENGKRWIVTSKGAGVEHGQKFELNHDPASEDVSAAHAVVFRPVGEFGDGYWHKMKSAHFDPASGSVKGWFSRLQNPQHCNYTVEIIKAQPRSDYTILCRVKKASAGAEVNPLQEPGEFGADEDG
ncbi:MAG: hypothetical protein GY856_39455 [bacterium]|nr:hypothetical protein [bacterium]